MSNSTLQPYLFFNGCCEEAIAFYRSALGAEVAMLMRFRESPEPSPPDMVPPDWGDKIMHASLSIAGNTLMVSDGNEAESKLTGFALALNVATEAEATRYFEALAAKGKVDLPLSQTFWSPLFGMVTDPFGVQWMIGVPSAEG